MKQKAFILFLMLALLCVTGAASAETAADLTEECKLSATVDSEHRERIRDGQYEWYWTGTGGSLTITLPKGKACQGISLSFFRQTVPLYISVQEPTGVWREAAAYNDPFRNAYIPVYAETAVNIRPQNQEDVLKLSALTVWGEGELPDSVQRWTAWEEGEEADLMLVVCHPDDDLIWFGGLIPYYAGQLHKKVLVAYAVGQYSARRVNELLDGLWTCGVRLYPELGTFDDLNGFGERVVLRRWGKEAADAWCTGLLRRYRPKVTVTHAANGESGHVQHVVLHKAVVAAVTEWSADPTKDPASAERYGVYTPLKFYVHQHKKNQIFLDWTQPLSAFSGKTGQEVAAEAFRRHISQIRSGYKIYVSGPNDSRYFGLYSSAVGPDEACNDMFEHLENESEEFPLPAVVE